MNETEKRIRDFLSDLMKKGIYHKVKVAFWCDKKVSNDYLFLLLESDIYFKSHFKPVGKSNDGNDDDDDDLKCRSVRHKTIRGN